MPATISSMMCDVSHGGETSVSGDPSPSQSSLSSRIMNGFSHSMSHIHHHNYPTTTTRRKYQTSISTQSSSSTTTSLERISTSTCTSSVSSASEVCLSRAEKDVQTMLTSDASTEEESDEDCDDEEEDDEDDDDEDEDDDEDDDSDSEDYDSEESGSETESEDSHVADEEEEIMEPFVSSWCFAMGTQRSIISSVGEKAPKSNVEHMEDWELDVVERAHRDSRLAELYADLSWRFYTHPPTSFCLARVFMRHGLTGNEGMSVFKLPRKANRRDSIDSSISSASGACSPALDESTLTKIMPTDEFRGGRGVASPSPPAALLSEPLSRMDVLSEKIWDYHNKVSQTDEMLQRKLHLRDMLYTAISPVFPLSGLYVVGSSLNGFGNNSSDMDLCLMITNKDLDQKNDAVVVLNLILSTLQYEKFVASQKLILAKVPILRIKFAAPFDDITVDLNANNSVAIRNTHLLCYYSSYDWRVRPLVSVVKEWAKRKGINDANKSSFTSYSLVLMVIHYLQCGTQTKVLPNLQQSYPTRFSNKVDVRTLNVTMPLEAVQDDIDPSLSENTTLGELLIGFLDYYANEFNYDRDAISIRQGKRVERAALAARPKVHLSSEGDKETPPPSSSASSSSIHNGVAGIPMHHSMSNPHFWRSQWRCVCIEEPFTNSNTAHSIYDEMVFGAIKDAFREAHGELQHNRDLDRLLECEPIKASTTNAGAAVFAATYEGERPLAQQPTSIASASLRAMNVIPSTNGNGHYHYQQQSNQQLMKQQRSGSNLGYQPSNNRGVNGNNNQHQQQNRRVYNSMSSSNAGNSGNGSGARSSKSNENVKESLSRPPSNPRNSSGSAKENLISTNGVTTLAEKKSQSVTKKDEGNRTKRSSAVQSPEPTKPKAEKTPTKAAQ
ncbi:CRE-GLD-2 protein [Caenorhabditis remanei]|uniref:polynucleotide adenylyltransferase n=2 Tax=Caenorhabditis remanei TaxID=31234 RepID=E3NEG2_CAERE|nr:CRE-GLD-2 protein [Caenorhabditis remanei]